MTGYEKDAGLSRADLKDAQGREDNPYLVSRQTWWIEYGRLSLEGRGPICTECARQIPDAPFTGSLVCDECAPYVPEADRVL
jgi:hypothetical protein